jgi:hypothetical protein
LQQHAAAKRCNIHGGLTNGSRITNGSRNVEKLFGVDEDMAKVCPEPFIRAPGNGRDGVGFGLVLDELDEGLHLASGRLTTER